MPDIEVPVESLQAVWDRVASRYAAYELVLPGSATFVCQAELCDAYCCRAYTVNLGEGEVARMARESGLEPSRFLEYYDGLPLALPMAQPFLLKREENRCALLGEDLRCGQYHGRPDACRLYPHFLVFIKQSTCKPVYADIEGFAHAVAAFVAGRESLLVPLLLRHVECPGFTGPPISAQSWWALFEATRVAQYAAV
ncbi:MAG: YkgJ family cysteine cluster protein [Anaerolineaceae bacterium]